MATKRKTTKKSPSKTSTKTSSKPAKTSATRKIPIQRAPERVSEPVVPSPSAGSLARHKAGLIAELKSERITPERQAAIRAELEQRPMSKTPILSHAELRRVGP